MTDETPSAQVNDNAEGNDRTYIVGVGASAGSLGSIASFCSRYKTSPDLAMVFVIQHREALDEAHLHEVRKRLGNGAIADAEDGQLIEGGKIYLCRPNNITTVHEDRFAVREAKQAPGDRGTIDSFIISLAEAKAEEAIGVILSGTNGDGTLGVAAIKERGGLAIAEQRNGITAELLADSSSSEAIADFILAAEDIPEHVTLYVRHLQRLEVRKGFDERLALAASGLSRVADILRSRTGNDFHG